MSEPPPFWDEKARRLIGGRVLVGVTYVDHAGALLEQSQFHGVIEAADRDGITVRRDDGETKWLPPDLRAFERADPGEYRLRATGEVVVDPDWLSAWTVHPES